MCFGPNLSAPSLALVVLILAAPLSSAQDTRVIEAGCDECSIELGDSVALRGIRANSDVVARLSDGRVAAVDASDIRSVAIYSPDGELLVRHSIGNAGDYHNLIDIWTTDDGRFYVLDLGSSNVGVLDPDMGFVRTIGLPARATSVLLLSEDRAVVNASVPTPSAAGLPLHLVEGGVIKLSFGSTDEVLRPDFAFTTRRHIASDGQGLVWSSRLTSYVLEAWDAETGEAAGRLVRNARDFPAWLQGSRTPEDGSDPRPMIEDIAVDELGRLWVLYTKADPNWRDHADVGEGGSVLPLNVDGFYDSVLEVIDPESGRLLGRREFDHHGSALLDGQVVLLASGILRSPSLYLRKVILP